MAKKKKTATKKASAKKPGKGKEMLVVASKVKGFIRGKKMMCSADAVGALSEHVYCMLDKAIARAQANRRSTVRPQDL
ncbi:MAG: hypothetical protein JW709_00865 [Sedimentisphaerales bacterium]|nr:hypothetical protein [Sedimentisphaerales bacterium]